jgi:type IX secretion system PorP/SprF family membrane protein
MKTTLLTILLASLMLNASAQQKPYFTQYIMNNYILNPAITGIENYIDVKLSYRNQWTDIVGAPKTMYASIHGPIAKSDFRQTPTSFELPGENPLGKTYWENYEAAAPHGGLGIIMMNDQTGYINRGSLYGTLAYHVGVSPRTSVSVGFIGGVTKVSLDRTKIQWATLDPNDPAIGFHEDLRKTKAEAGAGIWIYSNDYFLGGSVLNLVPGKVSFAEKEIMGNYFEPQYMATGGFRFFLTDDINVLPSAMVQFVRPYPIQTHYNLKLQYQDKMWVGASYRKSDELGGFASMVGVNVNSTFNFSYAYDVSHKSRLNQATGNTHEFIMGFMLFNRDSDTCPKNIW